MQDERPEEKTTIIKEEIIEVNEKFSEKCDSENLKIKEIKNIIETEIKQNIENLYNSDEIPQVNKSESTEHTKANHDAIPEVPKIEEPKTESQNKSQISYEKTSV